MILCWAGYKLWGKVIAMCCHQLEKECARNTLDTKRSWLICNYRLWNVHFLFELWATLRSGRWGAQTSQANASSALQFLFFSVFFLNWLRSCCFFQHALLLCDTPCRGQRLSGVGHSKTTAYSLLSSSQFKHVCRVSWLLLMWFCSSQSNAGPATCFIFPRTLPPPSESVQLTDRCQGGVRFWVLARAMCAAPALVLNRVGARWGLRVWERPLRWRTWRVDVSVVPRSNSEFCMSYVHADVGCVQANYDKWLMFEMIVF